VWVIQCGERACFLLEPEAALGIVREGIGQDLERDVTLQLGISRAVHLAHAAGAEQGVDAELADLAAWCQALQAAISGKGRRLAKGTGVIVRAEQRVDFGPQRTIVRTGVIQKRLPRARIETDGCGKKAADLRPSIGIDLASPLN